MYTICVSLAGVSTSLLWDRCMYCIDTWNLWVYSCFEFRAKGKVSPLGPPLRGQLGPIGVSPGYVRYCRPEEPVAHKLWATLNQ